MVDFAGWEIPVQFGSILEEHRAVRSRAGLFDVSHLGRIEVSGGAALNLIQHLFSNDLSNLKPGRARYSLLCNVDGGIIDDPLVFHLDPGTYLVACNAANTEKVKSWIERWWGELELDATVVDITERTAMLAIQGLRALGHLGDFYPSDLETLRPFDCVEITFEGHRAWMSRTGYTGEEGFELMVDASSATAFWRHFIDNGVEPCGLGARDSLRLEAGFLLYGNDMDEKTNPYEVGLERMVKPDKGEFVGRDALLRLRENEQGRQLVGFEVTGRGVARGGHDIVLDGQVVGKVSSGGVSPTLRKNIGLGFVPPGLTLPGTKLEIDIRGRLVSAQVVALPFYRREKIQ
jgi:aminomethyltransferase